MIVKTVENVDLKNYAGFIIPVVEECKKVEFLELPLENLKEQKKFEGKKDSTYRMTVQVEGEFKDVVLLGLGDLSKLTYRQMLAAFGNAFRLIKKQKVSQALTLFNNVDLSEDLVKAATEAMYMADYKFDDYLKSKKVQTIDVDFYLGTDKDYTAVMEEAKIVATANLISRDLVNQPANVMHPISLAEKVIELGKEKGFEVEVLDKAQIEALGMESYLAVSSGSSIDPRFIIMRYIGDKSSDDILGYVGKGLTYDSGGYSIKPTTGMVNMKDDMGGSAAVIGAMCAIAEAKLERNVVAVVAACENMISGSAYRPGDIIGSMGGKSIFIGNTDAEGRLTLIDAMHYIVTKENVTQVLDIATLTGAAIHCTGAAASVVISNNDEFYSKLQESYDLSGEQIWRMPIFDEYKELLKHGEADLTNIAGSPGTITAGLFIGEFTNNLPWIHIDIAGTTRSKAEKGVYSKGATGTSVKPLYYLAKNK